MPKKPIQIIVILGLLSGFSVTADASDVTPTILADLSKAQEQLVLALDHAQLSLSTRDPRGGVALMHLQHVVNILEGKTGANYAAGSPNPGDGYGAINYLRDAYALLKNQPDASHADEAIEFALAYLQEADEHALHALHGINPRHNAGLVMGMVSAALGQSTSSSPITGALAYSLNALQKR